MNTGREKQEQQYRLYGNMREGKYSEVSGKVYSCENGQYIAKDT